jgi:hypothetical protein
VGSKSRAFPTTRRAKEFGEAEIENDFQEKCRKGAKFAAHTAFSAILGEISCLFSSQASALSEKQLLTTSD